MKLCGCTRSLTSNVHDKKDECVIVEKWKGDPLEYFYLAFNRVFQETRLMCMIELLHHKDVDWAVYYENDGYNE